MSPSTVSPETSRFDWVDIAKGICIMLVVLMHSTLGVEKQTGETGALHLFIDWARPFRMPDFFLISGLFLAARIDRPWPAFCDSKVLHFAYFYVIWYTIQFVLRAPGLVADVGLAQALSTYAWGYVQPFGTLWFIYQLPVFFIAAKVLHREPDWLVLAAALVAHLLAPHTGSIVIDEFADRFVYFYAGYCLAGVFFGFAERIDRLPIWAVVPALAAWAAVNGLAVTSGVAAQTGFDLAFGFLGIAAVIATSVCLVRSPARTALTYAGRHSIAIYLAFTVFMAPARFALLKVLGPHSVDVIAVTVAVVSIACALLLRWKLTGTPLQVLFERPRCALDLGVGWWSSGRRTVPGSPAGAHPPVSI